MTKRRPPANGQISLVGFQGANPEPVQGKKRVAKTALINNQAKRKRVANGETTSDLVFSAYVGDNAEIFPKILSLHVPQGSVVADVTFGKGVFWKKIKLLFRTFRLRFL